MRFVLAAAALATLASSVQGRPAAADAALDLSGRWAIDPNLSGDDGGQPGAMGGRGQGGIGGAPPGAFPEEVLPAGPLPRGQRPGKAPAGDPHAAMREFAASPEVLIFGRDPDGTLTLDDGETLGRLYTDGRRFKRANGLLETKAQLKEGALLVESQPSGGGPRVTVSYSLDAKGRLLVVSTLKPASGKPSERRRVYVRAEADPPAQ